MKNLFKFVLLLTAFFIITSCKDAKDTASIDSKEAVLNDTINLMEESLSATIAGDKDTLSKIKDKGQQIKARAKSVGIDLDDPSTIPDDLKVKFEKKSKELMQQIVTETMKNALKAPSK